MKNFALRSVIAVAALAAAAVCASAQTYKAEIPIAFTAGSAKMAPGTYEFRVTNASGGTPTVSVQNSVTKRVAMVIPYTGADVPAARVEQGTPYLSFKCLDGNCALSKLYSGVSAQAYGFSGLRAKAAEKERLAVLEIGLTKAD